MMIRQRLLLASKVINVFITALQRYYYIYRHASQEAPGEGNAGHGII